MMKASLFFFLKKLYFIRRINSVLISLAFLLGNFLLFYSLIYDLEFISSRLILILPIAYLISESLLLIIFYGAIYLERSQQLDLDKINFQKPIIILEKGLLVKRKSDVFIANFQYAWSDQPDFLEIYRLIKSKIAGIIIGILMIISWPTFYKQPPGIISGWVIFLLLYVKMFLEDLKDE